MRVCNLVSNRRKIVFGVVALHASCRHHGVGLPANENSLRVRSRWGVAILAAPILYSIDLANDYLWNSVARRLPHAGNRVR